MSITKDDLNRLIQQLPDNALPFAADFLEKLISNPNNPKARNIPWDDEPTTKQDLEDIKNAKEAYARGEGIKFKDVIDELLS